MQDFFRVRYNCPAALPLRNVFPLLRSLSDNAPRRIASAIRAWLNLVLGAAALAAMSPVRAQSPDDGLLQAPHVDHSHVQYVHALAERWVGQGQVAPAGLVQTIPVTGVYGLRVTLRWGGERIMGIGDVFGDEVSRSDTGVVDLVAVAELATGRALEGVRQRAADSLRRSRQVASEEKQQEIFHRAIQDLLVDVQVALAPVEVRVPMNDSAAAGRLFAGGYHGLILATADKPFAGVLWPASVLAANVSPASQIVQLLAQAGLAAEDAKTLGQPGGPTLWRFRVIHLVRPRADQPPTVLTRGNVIMPVADFDLPTLDALADRLSANLAKRLGVVRAQPVTGSAQPVTMAGTYLPTTGEYDPPTAAGEELALTAYALARRVRLLAHIDPDSPAFRQAREATELAVSQLERMLFAGGPEAQAAPSPHAVALMMMAVMEAPHLADRKPLRDRLAAILLRLQNDKGLFLLSPAEDAQPLNTAAQSLMFAAMATLYEQTRDATIGQSAAGVQDAAWKRVADDQSFSAMPWLLIGESKLRGIDNPPQITQGMPAAQRIAIAKQMAQLALMHQINAAPDVELCPHDVVGGFDFTAPIVGSDTVPAPDWRSAEVLAFLAQALRDPDMVAQEDQLDGLLRCSLAGRFIAQLMFDEPSCYYVRGPGDAIGAVRAALDNNRLEVSATALTLLAATELQQTYYHMAERQR